MQKIFLTFNADANDILWACSFGIHDEKFGRAKQRETIKGDTHGENGR